MNRFEVPKPNGKKPSPIPVGVWHYSHSDSIPDLQINESPIRVSKNYGKCLAASHSCTTLIGRDVRIIEDIWCLSDELETLLFNRVESNYQRGLFQIEELRKKQSWFFAECLSQTKSTHPEKYKYEQAWVLRQVSHLESVNWQKFHLTRHPVVWWSLS